MSMRRPRRGGQALRGCDCGGRCGCKGDCPCKKGIGGFDAGKYDQALAVYERGAYELGSQFGQAVSAILADHRRGSDQNIILPPAGQLGGMGAYDIYTPSWSAADLTPAGGSAVDWSSFTPAGGSDIYNSVFDAGVMTITAPSGSAATAVDVTPWNDFTALTATPLNITPVDFSAITNAFSNFAPATSGCFSSPTAFASCAVNAAKNIAKGITGGAGGGSAGGGAASAAKPATTAKQASLAPFILIGLAVFAATELMDDS